MRNWLSATVLALLAVVSDSRAQDDATACQKDAVPEQRIAACTRLIAAKTRGPEDRSDYFANRGHAQHKLANNRAALQDLAIAIRLDPENFLAYSMRAGIHVAMGNFTAAAADYSSCMRVDPGNSSCRFLRGVAYVKARQYRAAIRDMDVLIAAGEMSGKKDAQAHAYRGIAYDGLGQRATAMRDYREALKLDASLAAVRKRLTALEAGTSPQVTAPEPAPRSAPQPGTPVNFAWRFRNNTGGSVQVKMYARERRNWWPSATTNWRMDSVGPYAFTISCRYGEKVCYGAWQVGNTDRYWGTGFQDRHGCESCCYACKEGQTTIYNLNP